MCRLIHKEGRWFNPYGQAQWRKYTPTVWPADEQPRSLSAHKRQLWFVVTSSYTGDQRRSPSTYISWAFRSGSSIKTVSDDVSNLSWWCCTIGRASCVLFLLSTYNKHTLCVTSRR
jgi:hypothetical protein